MADIDPRFYRPGRRPENKSPVSSYLRTYWSILVLLVVMVFMFVVLSIVRVYLTVPVPGATEKTVVVEPGMSVKSIARLLADQGIINKPWHFTVWVRFKGAARHIKAGRYTIPAGQPVPLVVSTLLKGANSSEQITVPEGLTIAQTADMIARQIEMDTAVFINLCRDSAFIRSLDIFDEAATLEGFLFPETYQVPWNVTEKEMIRMMVRQFKQIFLNEYAAGGRTTDLANYETLVLASIVEREALLDRERPIVAAVFNNRLKRRQYLESCATVNYILGIKKMKRVLRTKDLKVKSPYNTYMHFGLPPGPICSPGRASLAAALRPADTDVLYFVAKGDGSHHFSTTLREHVNAKHKYRKNYKK